MALEAASRLARFDATIEQGPRGQMAKARLRPATLRRGLGVAILAGLLAGCSLFGGTNSNGPSTGQTATAQSNVGAASTKPATTATPAEQQQIASGLVSDQQNTAYSDQPLTALSEQSSAPPPQVVTVTPSTTSGSGGAGAQAPAATAAPESTVASTASTPQLPAEVPAAEPAAASAVPAVQAPAAQPPPVQPQLAAAPQPTTGITPLAPPPNPLPPATQLASPPPQTMASSVSVDQSQLGGAAPQEQLYPAPYAPFYGAPSAGVVVNGSTYLAAPGGLPPPGSPIAVVFFADASSALSGRAMGVLRNVALIQNQLGGQLRVIGHASARTAAVSYTEHIEINQRLSQARANAVARALIGFGATQGTLSVAAVGSQQPVYFEFMPTGEAGNRRVEVYLDGPSVPAVAAAPAPAQPVSVAEGSVTIDLSALDQPAAAGGYYAGGPTPSYGQPGSVQLADNGYGSSAAPSAGGLLYPPMQNPVSMLTVPPPPGAEPYVAEQPQAPATASDAAAAPPPSSAATAETATPTAPADSNGTAADTGAATTMEQTAPTDATGTSAGSTESGSAAATTASATDAGATAGTGAASGTDTQQTATGATTNTGTAAAAVSSGETTTASVGGEATQTAPAPTAGSGGETMIASTGGQATQTVAAPAAIDGQVRIAFAKDSADIPDAAKSELDSLAQKMTADGSMRVELLAYASGTLDTATQARRLSLLRALAVRSYLIKQGVAGTRMDVRALGNKVQGDPADRVDLLPKS